MANVLNNCIVCVVHMTRTQASTVRQWSAQQSIDSCLHIDGQRGKVWQSFYLITRQFAKCTKNYSNEANSS